MWTNQAGRLVAAVSVVGLALAGCSGKRLVKVGDPCSDDTDCESGLCYESACLDPDVDADGDGLKNGVERYLGTDPFNADTDGDGEGDQLEVADVNHPLDTDGDKRIDAVESSLPSADPDHDCRPDEIDPDNEVASADEVAAMTAACTGKGVCADKPDVVVATCVEGLVKCDYSSVPGWEGEEATCDGRDNDCDGDTDEGAAAVCDDGDVCTTGDSCVSGACAGSGTLDCDDQRDCSVDTCDPLTGCLHEPDPRLECRPAIAMDAPERAARIDGEGTVAVAGRVAPGAGQWKVVSVAVNGSEVEVDPATFAFDVTVVAEQGINLVVVEATDEIGGKGRVAQSFYYSPAWHAMDEGGPDPAGIPAAVLALLGPQVWDDNGPDLDDLASLFQAGLETIDLMSLVQNPVGQGMSPCEDLVIDSLTRGGTAVDLAPVHGALAMQTRIADVVFHFHLTGTFCAGMAGTVTTTMVTTSVMLRPSIDTYGSPTVTATDATVQMDTVEVQGSGLNGGILDLVGNAMAGVITDLMEDSLAQQGEQGPAFLLRLAISSGLQELAPNGEIPVPAVSPWTSQAAVQAASKASFLGFEPAGGSLVLATDLVPQPVPGPDTMGSIGRGSCPSGDMPLADLPADPSVVIALHDDWLNRVSYALFKQGAIGGKVTGELLGIDLSSLGIAGLEVEVQPLLPPILTSCNVDERLFLQVGDLAIRATMTKEGEPVEVRAFASIEADAAAGIQGGVAGDTLAFSVSAVTRFEADIMSLPDSLAPVEGALVDAIRDHVAAHLLDAVGLAVPGAVPVPSFDLSTGGVLPLPPGSLVSIVPIEASREPGYTLVRAVMKGP
jgi:hypothetical protein